MSENIGFNIDVKASVQQAEENLKKLTDALKNVKKNKKLDVELNVAKDSGDIDNLITRIAKLKNEISSIKNQRDDKGKLIPLSLDDLKHIEYINVELGKLRSTYSKFLSDSKDLNILPIGNVKKQLEELSTIFNVWNGKREDFEKKFAEKFIMPNSYIERARTYKEIIAQLSGIVDKTDNTQVKKLGIAIDELGKRYRDALSAAKALNKAISETPPVKEPKVKPKKEVPVKEPVKEKYSVTNAFSSWDGTSGSFSKDVLNGLPKQATLEKQLAQLKAVGSELKNSFGGNAQVSDKYKIAFEELRKRIQATISEIKELKRELGTEPQVKISKVVEKETASSIKKVSEVQTSASKAISEWSKKKQELEELQARIKVNYIDNFKNNPQAYSNNFADLSVRYKDLQKTMAGAEKTVVQLMQSGTLFDSWADRFEKRAKWVVANFGIGAFYQGITGFFNAIKDVEKEMATFAQVIPSDAAKIDAVAKAFNDSEISVEKIGKAYSEAEESVNVYGKSLKELNLEDIVLGHDKINKSIAIEKKQLDDMKESLLGFAVKYGEAHEDVMKSATLWGRMYKDNNIVLTMTDSAMKLAVADSFSVVEANKNLESSVAQWGYQIKSNNDAIIVSNKICDSWTAIAHHMAVSAQDLSAANQRSASAMHAMNIEFDVGQALIATMLRNTQQSGEEIGNALKSIMGSIHSKKAIQDIEALGVSMYKTGKDGQREFRNVGEVLVDLMVKTDGTKKNLEGLLKDIAGGKFQWNKAAAMLNYSDFLNALTLSTQSYGFTNKQVEIQMDTLGRKCGSLHQELVKVASGMGGINSVSKNVIGGLTNIIKIIDSFSGSEVALLTFATIFGMRAKQIIPALKGIYQELKNIFILGKAMEMTGGGYAKIISIIIILGTILYDQFIKTGDAMNKLSGEADTLQKQIEYANELLARKEQGLKILPELVEMYSKLTEKQKEGNLTDEESIKLKKDIEKAHYGIINVVGEQQAKEIEESSDMQEATQNVIDKEKDRVKEQKNGIENMKEQLRSYTNKMLEETKMRVQGLDAEKTSWGELMTNVIKFGGILDWLSIHWSTFKRGAAEVSKGFSEWRLDYYKNLKANGTTFVNGTNIDVLISNIESQISSDEKSIADIDKEISDKIKEVQANASSEGLRKINELNNLTGDSNGLNNKYNGGNKEPPDYNSSSKSSTKNQRATDSEGNEITIPSENNFITSDGVDVSGLTNDTLLKLRVLDQAFYRKFGTHLQVTSTTGGIHAPGSNHYKGIAFDIAGGAIDGYSDEAKAARAWIKNYAPWIGLAPFNEYHDKDWDDHAHPEWANGDNMHLSNVTPYSLDEEGSEPAPSIYDIIGGKGTQRPNIVDNSPQRKVYDLLKKNGLSDKKAWAAMASIGYESAGFNPEAEEDSSNSDTGIGLMQWSNDPDTHEGRRKQLEGFASQRGTSWKDINTQLAFMQQEMDSTEYDSWHNFEDSVTDITSAYEDVASFTGNVERARTSAIDKRMEYYGDIANTYINGKSLKDSNPGKVKQLTPEEIAKNKADALKKRYDELAKSISTLTGIINDKYSFALSNVADEEERTYKNADTIQKKLDIQKEKTKDLTSEIDLYLKNIEAVKKQVNEKEVENLFSGSKQLQPKDKSDKSTFKDRFFGLSLDEQQKMMSETQNYSVIFAPVITSLNETIKLNKDLLKLKDDIKKSETASLKVEKEKRQWLYENKNKELDDKMKEWEIQNSNNPYDDNFKEKTAQGYLNEKAENARQYYDWLKGNEADPEKIEQQKLAWLEADAAANKYSMTLKNNVKKGLSDMAKSILIEGNSIRSILKNLWKQLAEDALTLLISGGRQGTGSLLGNVLRGIMGTQGPTYANSSFNWLGAISKVAPMISFGGGATSGLGSYGVDTSTFGSMFAYANGGEIDDEQIAKLGEGNKKEYVVPVEGDLQRGKSLWYKAGKDLGLIGNGTQIEPSFKNKDIAQNGVVSQEVKQQAIYMDEIRQQNKTLLNILSYLTNDKQSSDPQAFAMQPIIVKQEMSVSDFANIANKANKYGYTSSMSK